MRDHLKLWLAGVVGVLILAWTVWGQTSKPDSKPSPAGPPAKAETVAKPEQPMNLGTVVLRVPASATVWFGDQKTSQTGTERTFQSPPLEPGKTYAYTVKVSWPTATGRDFGVEQEVTVRANQTSRVDFTSLSGPAVGQPMPAPQSPYLPSRPAPPRRYYEGSGYRYH